MTANGIELQNKDTVECQCTVQILGSNNVEMKEKRATISEDPRRFLK